MADLTLNIRGRVYGLEDVTALKQEIQDLKVKMFEAAESTSTAGKNLSVNQQILKEYTQTVRLLTNQERINYEQKLRDITASQGTAKGMSSMAIAGQNLNFVLRDSPYFFRNFQLGVLAIGNNIDPLIQSMIRAKNEAKAMGSTFGRELLGFLKGPGGLIVAVSLLNAAFQAIVFSMSNSSKEAEKNKDAIQELIDKYITLEEKLSADIHKIETKSIGDLVILYRGLNEELKEYDNNITRLKTISTQGFSKEAIDFINALRGGTVNSGGKNELRSSIDEIANSVKNIIALTDKKQLGLFFAFDPTKSQTDLDAAKRALEEFGKSQSKFVTGTLKIGAEQFKLTGQQALNYAKAIDEAFSKTKKAKEFRDNTSFIDESFKLFEEDLKDAEKEIDEFFKEAIFYTNEYNDSIEDAKKATESFIDTTGKLALRGQISEENKNENALIKRYAVRQAIEEKNLEDSFNKAISMENLSKEQILQIDIAYFEAKKALADYYNGLIVEAEIQKYNKVLDKVGVIGEALQNAFSTSSDDFIAKLNQALQIAINIAKAIKEANNPNTDSLGGILGIIGSVIPILGLFHQGGIVKAHEGMLASDEIPIIARKGEMIFNDRQQGNLFNLINNPPTNRGGSGDTIVVNHYTTLDGDVIAKKQYKYLPGHLQRLSREGMLN